MKDLTLIELEERKSRIIFWLDNYHLSVTEYENFSDDLKNINIEINKKNHNDSI